MSALFSELLHNCEIVGRENFEEKKNKNKKINSIYLSVVKIPFNFATSN